jgi:hypothetical protein
MSDAEALGTLFGLALGGAVWLGGWIKDKLEDNHKNNITSNNNIPNKAAEIIANKRKKNAKAKDWLLFILCLFFGALGAHKFAEGKIGMGLLYLFTGGLCAIGWFIDIGKYLLKAIES